MLMATQHFPDSIRKTPALGRAVPQHLPKPRIQLKLKALSLTSPVAQIPGMDAFHGRGREACGKPGFGKTGFHLLTKRAMEPPQQDIGRTAGI